MSRERFEKWISEGPFERSVERYSLDPMVAAWPGGYKDIDVDLAWLAWQEAERQLSEILIASRDALCSLASDYVIELIDEIDTVLAKTK